MILGCLGLAVGLGEFCCRSEARQCMRCQLLGFVTLVRGPVEASMAACLSPMTRYLRGSQPRNSLLHLDYAVLGSSTLDHTRVLIRNTVFYTTSINDIIFVFLRRQINRQKIHNYIHFRVVRQNDNRCRCLMVADTWFCEMCRGLRDVRRNV